MTARVVGAPRRRVHEYRGVIIFPPNHCGMYTARVDCHGGGVPLAADTLRGMFQLIRDTLQFA